MSDVIRFRTGVKTRPEAPSHSPPDVKFIPMWRVVRVLGWFSIGLGAAELLAPAQVASLTGLPRRERQLLQLYGLREIVAGVGLLSGARPCAWLWGRVIGDAIDLATLGQAAATRSPAARARLASTAAVVAGVAAVNTLCAVAATHAD